MSSKELYKDRQRVETACNAILQVIQPGDVVNQEGDFRWWEFWLAFGSWAIQCHQKKLFGKKANWRDNHTMLFFDEDNTFSVELPRATLKPIEEYCLSNLSIYRFTLMDMEANHVTILRQSARRMIGTDYDIGQLLDIAINGILGYEHQRKLSIFDFGRKKKVCSVGVRVAYEALHQAVFPEEAKEHKWLFDRMKPDKWPEKKIRKFEGTDVEATAPAHFANADYFQNEFKLVARFKEGKRV